MDFYPIDEGTKTNLQALLEELQTNGTIGPESLYAWWLGEQEVIKQSIMELEHAPGPMVAL